MWRKAKAQEVDDIRHVLCYEEFLAGAERKARRNSRSTGLQIGGASQQSEMVALVCFIEAGVECPKGSLNKHSELDHVLPFGCKMLQFPHLLKNCFSKCVASGVLKATTA